MIGSNVQSPQPGVQKAFKDVKTGEKIRLVNSAGDIYCGIVMTAGFIQGRWMIDLDCISLIRGGYQRTRWQRKSKRFANCPGYVVWVLNYGTQQTNSTSPGQQVNQTVDPRVRVRQVRAAFVNNTNVFQQRRDEYERPEDVLGVPQGSTVGIIKKAYHRLALQFHPDKNPGDKEAEVKFVRVQKAYAALTNR